MRPAGPPLIEALGGLPVARRRVELVERKGVGHPDTICDAVVEAAAQALARLYLDRVGTILHHNVDKALLAAGRCEKGFGGGRLVEAPTLLIGDRATFETGRLRLPVEETVLEAVDRWVLAHLPHVRPGRDLHARVLLAPGSAGLRAILGGGPPRPVVANDTSAASGYAPLSPTEALVLAIERHLNGPEFKAAFPDTGEDVKVMAVRVDERVDVTVAMPLLCRQVDSEAAYFARKAAILATLAERFAGAPFEVAFALNTLDAPGQGADGCYLTLTGTSAEDADSGQVGRGNRANGVIPLSRPSSAEAAPGKNAVAHPGKIYSVLSHRLAADILARCPELLEVYVHLVARIGEPVDRPWTAVQLVLPEGMALDDVAPSVGEVVEAALTRMPVFREELVRGRYPVC